MMILRNRVIAHLLINEIACGTSGDDWVELYFQSDERERIDISKLFVTMYYGTNEHLSDNSITIYSYDRPETPYDDRFAVVHLTNAYMPDETDFTGDTNHNGYIDIYCNNYSGSLWNSDGVIAIDNDDEPDNGGIIDFAAYSNRDGSPNETIRAYVIRAQDLSQWSKYSGENIQDCMIDIGSDGLSPTMTISRSNYSDRNSMDDFQITRYQTPGRPNIFNGSVKKEGCLFKTIKRKVTIIPSHPVLGEGTIDIFVYETCNIRFRIFSSIGMLIHESPLYRNICPGRFSLKWNCRRMNRPACTGLYIGHIEATSSSLKKSDKEYVYIILSRYR
jgi:hypothetical protein